MDNDTAEAQSKQNLVLEPPIRVERVAPDHHEWRIYLTVATEWGPDERLIDDVDDCDTEVEALAAARRLLEARGWL